jgi:hypothetical protein
MDYILRDIDIELWSKVKAKAILERKTMCEVIFEGLKWYVASVDTPPLIKRRNGRRRRIQKLPHGQIDL